MKRALFGIALGVIVISIILLAVSTYAAGVAQHVQIGASAAMGIQGIYPQNLFQYSEGSTTTAQYAGSTVVTIPAASTNNQIVTSTLFPAFVTPLAIGLQDVTDPGVVVGVGMSAGAPRVQMAANGFILYRTASGLPTFFVDNATATDAQIQVFGLSN